jgi:hypothetical protein
MGRQNAPGRVGLNSTRITTATTTAVSAKGGTVHRVVVEVATAGITTFNDALGAKTIWPAAWPVGIHELNIGFAGKIEVVTAGADRLVIVWE